MGQGEILVYNPYIPLPADYTTTAETDEDPGVT